MKIKLPDWVFRNLKRYGNCALPNDCNEMDRAKLLAYLEAETGFKIKLRDCEFKHCDEKTMTKVKRISKYIMAEVQ